MSGQSKSDKKADKKTDKKAVKEAAKQKEFEERVERNLRSRSLDSFEGEDVQRILRILIAENCDLHDVMSKKMDMAQTNAAIMRQQNILIEQNFIIMQLLNRLCAQSEKE
jgi:hypothetical protein